MIVGVTGSGGFIGKNLLDKLKKCKDVEIITFTRESSLSDLEGLVKKSDFIFHLAGVNRPSDTREFYSGNQKLTQKLVDLAISLNKKTPILMSSSVQIAKENDYGISKREGELALQSYAEHSGAPVYIYRLRNVFGKWSRPNYNTVIATWCYNICRNIPVVVNDDTAELDLIYIDDVIMHFLRHLDEDSGGGVVYPEVFPVYKKSLSTIKALLESFKDSRKSLLITSVGKGFERALYSTYLSYLPTNEFSYKLKGYKDERGDFYEFIKTNNSGQFSISTSGPGVTRGNHYHDSKNEKFLVVRGEASIKLRQIHGEEVIEYKVSDKKFEVVDMIPGYTHNITNTGTDKMILLLWANEVLDKESPDTYFLEV